MGEVSSRIPLTVLLCCASALQNGEIIKCYEGKGNLDVKMLDKGRRKKLDMRALLTCTCYTTRTV